MDGLHDDLRRFCGLSDGALAGRESAGRPHEQADDGWVVVESHTDASALQKAL